MTFQCESENLQDYLSETDEVNYSHPLVKEKAAACGGFNQTEIERIRAAYEFVRDEIAHSWDIQSHRVTCTASEVLEAREGICYAKSNLLAALLRAQGIPAGFCYQRLTLGATPDTGYCLHALNAVYVRGLRRWIRLDARGNKPGVRAEFSVTGEKLAFPIREAVDERDYPLIYMAPNPETISVLRAGTDAINMYKYQLPAII